jgi:hypothetical protein
MRRPSVIPRNAARRWKWMVWEDLIPGCTFMQLPWCEYSNCRSTHGTCHNTDSFANSENHVWIGRITCINYQTEDIEEFRDLKQWFLHKLRPFASEQELRAIMLAPTAKGIDVPCVLPALIESIRLAPNGPVYLLDLVSDICNRYGLDVPVRLSELEDEPFRYTSPELNR